MERFQDIKREVHAGVDEMAGVAEQLLDPISDAIEKALAGIDHQLAPGKLCMVKAAALLTLTKATALHIINDHGFDEATAPGAMNFVLELVRKKVVDLREGKPVGPGAVSH